MAAATRAVATGPNKLETITSQMCQTWETKWLAYPTRIEKPPQLLGSHGQNGQLSKSPPSSEKFRCRAKKKKKRRTTTAATHAPRTCKKRNKSDEKVQPHHQPFWMASKTRCHHVVLIRTKYSGPAHAAAALSLFPFSSTRRIFAAKKTQMEVTYLISWSPATK